MVETLYKISIFSEEKEVKDDEKQPRSFMYQKSPWQADIYSKITTKHSCQTYTADP
jgi:hypothetical protein